MGSENLKLLRKSRLSASEIDLARDLADLEPIRQRLEQVAGEHPGDPEVQKAVEETKRLLLSRVARLTPSTSRPAGQRFADRIPSDSGRSAALSTSPRRPFRMRSFIPTLPATPVGRNLARPWNGSARSGWAWR